jgi:hypothetical protein
MQHGRTSWGRSAGRCWRRRSGNWGSAIGVGLQIADRSPLGSPPDPIESARRICAQGDRRGAAPRFAARGESFRPRPLERFREMALAQRPGPGGGFRQNPPHGPGGCRGNTDRGPRRHDRALGRLERGTARTWRTMSCKAPMRRRADQYGSPSDVPALRLMGRQGAGIPPLDGPFTPPIRSADDLWQSARTPRSRRRQVFFILMRANWRGCARNRRPKICSTTRAPWAGGISRLRSEATGAGPCLLKCSAQQPEAVAGTVSQIGLPVVTLA